MLAGQFVGRRKIELVDVPEPQLGPGRTGKIIFQPEVACLCGSDLPFFDAAYEGHEITYPQPVGMSLHEMVGTVVKSGSSIWQPGSRVLAVPVHQRGLYERFVLSEDRVVAIDDRLPDEIALLAQPLGTVIWGLRKLPNMIDREVAVIGLGPIGQMFVAGLRNLGARRIVGVDPNRDRVRLAIEMGATHGVAGIAAEVETEVRDALSGQLPEIVVEAVGHRAQALNAAISLSANAGTVLYFGVPPDSINGVQLKAAMLKNVTLLTSLHPDFDRTFPLAMQWLAEERIDIAPLITHRYPLAEIQQAFDTFRDARDGAVKVLVEFPALNM